MAEGEETRSTSSSMGDNWDPRTLLSSEVTWRDRQTWLEERGYILRPRYRPGWKPSWEGTNKNIGLCEDAQIPLAPNLLDATRVSDGSVVMLKRIRKSVHPYEVGIAQFFSTAPQRSDPRNHCIRVYDVLHDPFDGDMFIIVMPLLRYFDEPRFMTIGESVEFFRQLFIGIQFMHANRVAHRDIYMKNIMLDPTNLYPQMFHAIARDQTPDFSGEAKHFTRTERPVRYYVIDFGLSRRYSLEDRAPRELPIWGGDRTVPEFQDAGYNNPANPYAADVYCLGNLIRQQFFEKFRGFDFMKALVADMVQEAPEKRPTMDEVVARFDRIRTKLSWLKLRAPLLRNDRDVLGRLVFRIAHVYWTASWILHGYAAVPVPATEPDSAAVPG